MGADAGTAAFRQRLRDLTADLAFLVIVLAVRDRLARLTPDPLTSEHASYAILAAVASDTVSKVAIGAVIGRGWFAAEIGAMALLCIAGGGAVLALTLAFAFN